MRKSWILQSSTVTFHSIMRHAGTGTTDSDNCCQRSFAVNRPRTWNRLPAALRSAELMLCSFKRQLKAHLSQHLSGAGCSDVVCHHPAPLWLFYSESGAIYKYPHLLTYQHKERTDPQSVLPANQLWYWKQPRWMSKHAEHKTCINECQFSCQQMTGIWQHTTTWKLQSHD